MSPRSEALNQRMRDDSRALILRTALKLFARHGYEGTSIAMIAKEAGIAQGLLYNYFAGKKALLRAIFEMSMRDVEESFALADAGPSPTGRIEHLVRGAFAIVRRNQDFWRLSYSLRMQPAVVSGLGKRLGEWTAKIRETLTRFLHEAGVPQPELEAALLFALIDGVSQHYVLEPSRYPLDAVADRIIQRFTRA
ncbi:MAG TPA: TetR/AcrR family transcriptional regulator [Gemmatimonadaceae bacterium]|nr:TetR/AcrR family transcriptional regulator [Gemmatimonadaceae bacterium]